MDHPGLHHQTEPIPMLSEPEAVAAQRCAARDPEARSQLARALRDTAAAHRAAAEQAAREGNEVMSVRHRRAATDDELLAEAYEVRVESA